MIGILTAVSSRDLITAKARGTKAKKSTKGAAPYDTKVLSRAYEPALTKYGALTSFFEIDKRDVLIQEVTQDLDTDEADQMTYICSFVKKQVRRAYGAWLKSKKLSKI